MGSPSITSPEDATHGAGRKVIVVGGGISGQTAAYRLHRRGFDVTVLEADPTVVGGEMSSTHKDGYLFNRASTLIPASYDQLIQLAEDLGLKDRILGTVPAVTSIPRDGVVHRLRASGPGAAIDGITTDLLSLKAKLSMWKLAADTAKVKSKIGYDGPAVDVDTESLGEYTKRRLNPEVETYVVGALVRAAYLYEPESLSVLDFFFAASKFSGIEFLKYEGGMDFINQGLAKVLNRVPGARVINVEQRDGGVTVTYEKDGREQSAEADACVIAIQAPRVPALYPQLTERQKDILSNRIRYGSIIKASHALKSKSDDPTIMLSIPRVESEALGIITFDHNYRTACAPEGRGLIASHWMHDWNQSRLDPETVSDEKLEAEMIPEVARFIPNFRKELEFSFITRWPMAAPVSYSGMYKFVEEFRDSVAPTSRVQFCGDYFNVPGTKAASLSGERAANAVTGIF